MSIFQDIAVDATERILNSYRVPKGSFGFTELCDLFKIIRSNLTYAGSFNRAVLDNWYAYRQALLNCSDVSDRAIPGHRVRVICKNGRVYEKALICREYGSSRAICMNAGPHLHRLRVGETGALSMSVSGGYFHWHEKLESIPLKPDGFVDSNYWFWGESAGANRGIYITFPMRRWLIDDSDGELGFY